MVPITCHLDYYNSGTLLTSQVFPGGSDGKASAYQGGDPGFSPWVGKILWRRKWQPLPVLLPGKPHGRWSLVVYSPWGCKESDTTERLHFLSFFVTSLWFPLQEQTEFTSHNARNLLEGNEFIQHKFIKHLPRTRQYSTPR